MKIKLIETDERLLTPSGLVFVGEVLQRIGFSDVISSASKKILKNSPRIKDGPILTTYVAMLCQGKPYFDAVKETNPDPEFFETCLGIKALPSSETLRQRMDLIGDKFRNLILEANIKMFQALEIKPKTLSNGYAVLDFDVTPFDNSKSMKEGVSRTYKGFDGYAPMMAYIFREGYLLNAELREGSQHCQKDTGPFLEDTLKMAFRVTDEKLLVRMDSGNDATENMDIMLNNAEKVDFLIKRNFRSTEAKEQMVHFAENRCSNIQNPRDGKVVYVGSKFVPHVYHDKEGNEITCDLRIVYEINIRTIDKYGQALLVPDYEVNAWWTTLTCSDEEVIQLYHEHGECEQFHSEIKTDMDVERLPSGKFDTNKLVLELTILAYNILRYIGQTSLSLPTSPKLKHDIRRRRIRTVIMNLIQIAGHITSHARNLLLSIGQSNYWGAVFRDLFHLLIKAA